MASGRAPRRGSTAGRRRVGRRARGTHGRATRRAHRCRRCRRTGVDRRAGSSGCQSVVSEGVTEHRSSRAPALGYGRLGGQAHRAVHVDRRPRAAGAARTRPRGRPRQGGSDRPVELHATRRCPTGSPRPSATSSGCWPTAIAVRSCRSPSVASTRESSSAAPGTWSCVTGAGARHPTRSRSVARGWPRPRSARPSTPKPSCCSSRHAFEQWEVWRVAICTDALNQRSRDAIERLGAQFEGILRSHRLVNQPGETRPRDTAVYSIISAEWPAVRDGLVARLARAGGSAPPAGSPSTPG